MGFCGLFCINVCYKYEIFLHRENAFHITFAENKQSCKRYSTKVDLHCLLIFRDTCTCCVKHMDLPYISLKVTFKQFSIKQLKYELITVYIRGPPLRS